ncbi:unnamed protein product [Tetraodon nigroviridis]|uniref:(spotted green pufferfish) hypothetical protein n=1 Tax=Tetraodon nigroviridis TaxID=99883 RepID=Q4SNY4_TETNG|nr:unnamed protein product [Tetraodon nigroviridis]
MVTAEPNEAARPRLRSREKSGDQERKKDRGKLDENSDSKDNRLKAHRKHTNSNWFAFLIQHQKQVEPLLKALLSVAITTVSPPVGSKILVEQESSWKRPRGPLVAGCECGERREQAEAAPKSDEDSGLETEPPRFSCPGTFPIDLAKTRLQVQGQVGDSKYREIRYRGMLHAMLRIGREEGPRALYSGIAPALLRQASYGTIKIGTYQSFKRLLVDAPEEETLLTNVICGILSGVISSTIANPTDVLKIRMQAQGNLIQGSMMGNFIDIYQQEGTRGLWKGVSLTAQRAAIVVGVELPAYDITKKHLILSGYMGDTVYTHFLSSFVCGLAGALASNPVDVVRTRLMNQRGGALYQGTWTASCRRGATRGSWPSTRASFPTGSAWDPGTSSSSSRMSS